MAVSSYGTPLQSLAAGCADIDTGSPQACSAARISSLFVVLK